MKTRFNRSLAAFAASVIGLAVAWIASGQSAQAVACSSPVKYASTSNTIYLLTPQPFTLSDIKRYCASAPLILVDPATKTWELSADLVIQNGASLVLHGDRAQAGAGDVNTLRLRSLADNSPIDVQNITAKWGTVDADAMTLTSWDDATGRPDTNPWLPNGSDPTLQGRAFIRAISYVDTDGSLRQSTMNIVNSTFSYLGYYAGESYGVAFKAEGCDHTHLDVCAKLWVTGKEINSHFVGNFMGTYTWGANNMSFLNNEYGSNVMYGLDPHDVSRNLDIEYNRFHDNGDHGVICSQKCDNLIIEHNESDHNGMVPWAGTDPDNNADGQVHGIMIHRGVTNTTIAYNYVHDEPTGAGIAVFDSANDSIHDNVVSNTKYGLRLSVGSAGNTFSNNTVTNSSQYAVYMYMGSDLPENSTPNGHPTANRFVNNVFDTSGSNLIKTTEADGNIFTNNTLANGGNTVLLQKSAGTIFTGNTVPSTQTFSLTGSTAEPSSAQFKSITTPIKVQVDSNSVVDFHDAAGVLFAAGSLTTPTKLNPADNDLTLGYSQTGGSPVIVTPAPYTVVPTSSGATAFGSAPGGIPDIRLDNAIDGQTFAFTVGGLTPLRNYVILRAGAVITSVTASSSGVVAFSDTPGSVSSVDYTVATN